MTRLALLLCCAVAAFGAASAGAATRDCGSLSVGPGALRHGSTSGAACLLAAFRTCTPAGYTLSNFGVDTIASDVFRIQATSGRCQIQVTGTFRVVPQRPHTTLRGVCLALKRTATDIVATGCRGTGATATISLTGRH
jgi:hypothetical protein